MTINQVGQTQAQQVLALDWAARVRTELPGSHFIGLITSLLVEKRATALNRCFLPALMWIRATVSLP
jgi:hypothetical protein